MWYNRNTGLSMATKSWMCEQHKHKIESQEGKEKKDIVPARLNTRGNLLACGDFSQSEIKRIVQMAKDDEAMIHVKSPAPKNTSSTWLGTALKKTEAPPPVIAVVRDGTISFTTDQPSLIDMYAQCLIMFQSDHFHNTEITTDFIFRNFVFLQQYWLMIVRDCREGYINNALGLSRDESQSLYPEIRPMEDRSLALKALFDSFKFGVSREHRSNEVIDLSISFDKELLNGSTAGEETKLSDFARKTLGIVPIANLQFEEFFDLHVSDVPQRLTWDQQHIDAKRQLALSDLTPRTSKLLSKYRVNPNSILMRTPKDFDGFTLSPSDARAKFNEYCERRKAMLDILANVRKPDRLEDESKSRWGHLSEKEKSKAESDWIKLRIMHGHAVMKLPPKSTISFGPMKTHARNTFKGSILPALEAAQARGIICASCGTLIFKEIKRCAVCDKEIDYDELVKEYENKQYGVADHLVDVSSLPILIKGNPQPNNRKEFNAIPMDQLLKGESLITANGAMQFPKRNSMNSEGHATSYAKEMRNRKHVSDLVRRESDKLRHINEWKKERKRKRLPPVSEKVQAALELLEETYFKKAKDEWDFG